MRWTLFLITSMLLLSTGCAPKITNIVPYSQRPGETVTIYGQGLTVGEDNPTSVDFNDEPASDFWADGDNVVSMVPVGATSGPVHVARAYVDLLHPSGTATSPSDFTVIVDTTYESEVNDYRPDADLVETNGIRGTLSTSGDEDWFQIPTGAAGPYGYTLEFYARAEALPDGVDLCVEVRSAADEILCMLYVGGHTGDVVDTCWTAQAPDSTVYLYVYHVGSTSEWHEVSYDINLARIPINDLHETADNDYSDATPITPGDVHTSSYLAVTGTSGSDVNDYYRFTLARPENVMITVVSAGLPTTDGVRVYLLDPYRLSHGEEHGTPEVAALTVDLIEEYRDPATPFPAGEWYVLVTNAFGEMASSGEGSSPVCFKRPYRLVITID